MELKGSLPCSQQPATGHFPERDSSIHNFPPYFPKILSNIIIRSTPSSYEWSLPFRITDQKFILISYLSHACYMTGTSHPPAFDHSGRRITLIVYLLS